MCEPQVTEAPRYDEGLRILTTTAACRRVARVANRERAAKLFDLVGTKDLTDQTHPGVVRQLAAVCHANTSTLLATMLERM
jgi:hypothetical protein